MVEIQHDGVIPYFMNAYRPIVTLGAQARSDDSGILRYLLDGNLSERFRIDRPVRIVRFQTDGLLIIDA